MCFSSGLLYEALRYLIILAAVVAILRLLLPYVLNMLGVAGGIIMQVINIVIGAAVALFVLWLCWQLLGCLEFPRLYH